MVADPGQPRPHPGERLHGRDDPAAVPLGQRPGDAVHEPHLRPLPAVVQEAREQQVGIAGTEDAQAGHHVEAVATVGDGHGVEQGELRGRQPRGEGGALLVGHPGGHVGTRLADLTPPPGA